MIVAYGILGLWALLIFFAWAHERRRGRERLLAASARNARLEEALTERARRAEKELAAMRRVAARQGELIDEMRADMDDLQAERDRVRATLLRFHREYLP